jgi:hypothetical protein
MLNPKNSFGEATAGGFAETEAPNPTIRSTNQTTPRIAIRIPLSFDEREL